jgi:TPR repeat protein
MFKNILFALSFFIASSAFAGFDEGYSAYQNKEYATALKEWEPLAKKGDSAAQNNLGWMYKNGQGVKRDMAKAAAWYLKAAAQGNAHSQKNIGDMYKKGEGVKKNIAEAIKWYGKAAEQGDKDGQAALGDMYNLGLGMQKDTSAAANWYRKAAEQGHIGAQTILGEMYYSGEGVEKDLTEAINWTRKAADQEGILAQSDLGDRYYFGQGVQKDLFEAVKWYRKAAEEGDASAQYSIGFMYARGQGVGKNENEAMNWLRKSSDQGNESAKKEIARIEIVRKQAEQELAAQRLREENERKRVTQVGQQICRNLDGITLSQPIPYVVMGAQQYHKNTGEAKVSGFVEGASGDKIQIRISSITFLNTTEVAQTDFDVNNKGIVNNVQMNSLSGYKGSVLRSDGIIWDDPSGWSICN